MARPPSINNGGLLTFVLGWCLVISLIAGLHPALMSSVHGSVERHARAAFAGHHHPTEQQQQQQKRGCPPLPDLGFDYPPLRPAREALAAFACAPPLPPSAVAAAYARALDRLDPSSSPSSSWTLEEEQQLADDDGSSSSSSSSTSNNSSSSSSSSDGAPASAAAALERFLDAALGHVAAAGQVLPCRHDPSLLAEWYGSSTGGNSSNSNSNSHHRRRRRDVLFAAALVNAGHAAPNLIVQALRLALALAPPRGRLAVSVLESGSADLTRQWLSLLRMLLVPLGVDARIALNAPLRRPARGGDRIAFMAALRNAVLEPFFPAAGSDGSRDSNSGGSSGNSNSSSSSGGDDPGQRPRRWVPDAVLFANDVYFCARDALRLLLHGADLACGLDFYAAPWQQARSGGEGGRTRRGGGAGEEDDEENEGSAAVLAAAEAGDGGGGASGGSDDDAPAARRRALLSGDGEEGVGSAMQKERQVEQQHIEEPPIDQEQHPSALPLRFYDKWVARDITGARLRNLPPYASHGPSAARLRAGLPFPAICCWNGLAALAAAPLAAGLRFRAATAAAAVTAADATAAGAPSCRASECSLLCDDLHRRAAAAASGGARVVIDAGVRVAYEWEQALALVALERGGDDNSKSSSSSSSSSTSSSKGGAAPLGAPGSYAEAAAALAADRASSAREWAPRLSAVECCDLPPGKAYVDFRRDCRRVDVLAGGGG